MAGAGREAKSLGRHEAASVAAGPRGEPGRRPHVRLVKPQLRRGAHPGARPRLGCERGRGAGARGKTGYLRAPLTPNLASGKAGPQGVLEGPHQWPRGGRRPELPSRSVP